MKINFLKLLLLVPFFILTSCADNAVREPEQIGKHLFGILKELDTKSEKDFLGDFLSHEELMKVAKKASSSKVRKKMEEIGKDKWEEQVGKIFKETKKKQERYGIIWKDIKYLDFDYETENSDGIMACEGVLGFTFNDEGYKIKATSVYLEDEFKIVEIKRLTKK